MILKLRMTSSSHYKSWASCPCAYKFSYTSLCFGLSQGNCSVLEGWLCKKKKKKEKKKKTLTEVLGVFLSLD